MLILLRTKWFFWANLYCNLVLANMVRDAHSSGDLGTDELAVALPSLCQWEGSNRQSRNSGLHVLKISWICINLRGKIKNKTKNKKQQFWPGPLRDREMTYRETPSPTDSSSTPEARLTLRIEEGAPDHVLSYCSLNIQIDFYFSCSCLFVKSSVTIENINIPLFKLVLGPFLFLNSNLSTLLRFIFVLTRIGQPFLQFLFSPWLFCSFFTSQI